MVSVCPTGRGLTPPTGCPTSYTRIWCGDGSSEKTLCEHITLHSLGRFFALPIQIQLAHAPGGAVLCLDTQQTSLASAGICRPGAAGFDGWQVSTGW
jgi:hypothetical protein